MILVLKYILFRMTTWLVYFFYDNVIVFMNIFKACFSLGESLLFVLFILV